MSQTLGLTLGAAALLTLGACGGGDAAAPQVSQSPAPPTSPPSSPAAEQPSDQPPQVIAYAGGESPGVFVHQPADVRRLHGAPDSFKEFVATVVRELDQQSSCDSAAVGVTVQFLRPDGYAVGGVSDCGGYVALWAIVDGSWKEIAGTQDLWECSTLKKYAVPSDIAGDTCYDPDARTDHRYHQA